MKRIFDFNIAAIALILLCPVLLCIWILVKVTSAGPGLYWSKRVGINSNLFSMPKFRTMRSETPEVASDLLNDPTQYMTSIGIFLRKSSLDELPQLWSILIGDMSLVGPRPALFNQYYLVELRKVYGLDTLKPGLTGWAQINGRDEISDHDKVIFDNEYLLKRSFIFDLKICILTVHKIFAQEGIHH
jgi:O-antigen biosynthesis protein WbqP